MIGTLIKQLFSPAATNKFPAKYAPKSITKFLAKGKIHPPVPTPPNFRGKISYDFDKCVGCTMCARVCPANVITIYDADVAGTKKKKVKFELARCAFCGQCADVCPVKCIKLTDEFLLATTDRKADSLIVK